MEVNKVPVITAEYLCPVISSVSWKQDNSKVVYLLSFSNMKKAAWKCKILSAIICLCGENVLGKMKPKLYSSTERERMIVTQTSPPYGALFF